MVQPTDNFGEDAVTSWNVAGFEELYASAGDDLGQVPWARLGPNSTLAAWLDTRTDPPGRTLVVGCGLGDDAEELARRGHRITAFDLSETAIGWCRTRFPQSDVDYQVADLLDPPAGWAGAFDLVVELYTIQSLPLGTRRQAVAAIAAPVAPGGTLFLRCFGRADDAPVDLRPWPVSRAELGWFADEGLTEVSLTADGTSFFVGVYRR